MQFIRGPDLLFQEMLWFIYKYTTWPTSWSSKNSRIYIFELFHGCFFLCSCSIWLHFSIRFTWLSSQFDLASWHFLYACPCAYTHEKNNLCNFLLWRLPTLFENTVHFDTLRRLHHNFFNKGFQFYNITEITSLQLRK